MKTMVFFLEEPSAEAMLRELLPRILPPEILLRYRVFEGKQDLEKNLVKKLQNWQSPDSLFVILRDQDSANCRGVKQKLFKLCQESGKKDVLIRVACRELESFYLGDLAAVETSLKLKNIAHQQNKNKFRAPDNLGNPSEELKKLTKNRYQKVSGSRAIAPHLSLSTNKSHSFNILLAGIRGLIESQ